MDIIGMSGLALGIIGTGLGLWNFFEKRQLARAEKISLVETEEESLLNTACTLRILAEEVLWASQRLAKLRDSDHVRRTPDLVAQCCRALEEGKAAIERRRQERADGRRMTVLELEDHRRRAVLTRGQLEGVRALLEKLHREIEASYQRVSERSAL